MEKLIYLIWCHSRQTRQETKDYLLHTMARTLIESGAYQLRLNIADEDVIAANKLLIRTTQPAPNAVISFWLHNINVHSSIEKKLLGNYEKLCGYLVKESEPLPNIKHPATNGTRTYGMNQVVFLRKPDHLSYGSWIDLWLDQHTPIAIRTQSTFGYRQNRVVRALTDNALKIDAIVEENFPPEAMSSAHAFYNAIGDDGLLRKNQSEMFSSVRQFVDLEKIDCIPMSEYNF